MRAPDPSDRRWVAGRCLVVVDPVRHVPGLPAAAAAAAAAAVAMKNLQIWGLGPTSPTRFELGAAYRLARASGQGTQGACACGGLWRVSAFIAPDEQGQLREHAVVAHSSAPCERFRRDPWLYFRLVIMPATADA